MPQFQILKRNIYALSAFIEAENVQEVVRMLDGYLDSDGDIEDQIDELFDNADQIEEGHFYYTVVDPETGKTLHDSSNMEISPADVKEILDGKISETLKARLIGYLVAVSPSA